MAVRRAYLNDQTNSPLGEFSPGHSGIPSPIDFFDCLVWLDGRPLMQVIEPYRRRIFERALFTFSGPYPKYDRVLCGRAKKNWKSADLILAALYKFLVWPSGAGNDCFILANDEQQAGDDLALAKKLILANPILAREVDVRQKEIIRRDGHGTLKILPAQDVAGSHGKTYLFCGFDEIHAYRDYNLLEALSPDPTRRDVLTWITSYAGIRHAPGVPLYDFMRIGREAADPRMLFSWYGADFTTDRQFQGDDISGEERANPSFESWGNDDYLVDQKRRLPAHKYRRLHLNLPGAPDGAAFSGEHVMAAIIPGRRSLPRQDNVRYSAFVDMSGGSNDDAALGIAHKTERGIVLDLLVSQGGRPPFDPRGAVRKFGLLLREYGIARVTGDAFAGMTYRYDFQNEGIAYSVSKPTKSELYQELEPRLNAGEVELLDIPQLQEQLLTLVWRGQKIDHQPGDHDDFANAAAGAIWAATSRQPMIISDQVLMRARIPSRYRMPIYG